jgi:hypothetical protein
MLRAHVVSKIANKGRNLILARRGINPISGQMGLSLKNK